MVQGTYYHLWFLYSLVSIYLILPVLRLMVRPGMDRRILWYLIGLWLFFQPLSLITNKFWNFNLKIAPPLATGFVCYFLLGYLLGEIALSRLKMILAVLLWAIGTLITIIGTYFFTQYSDQFDSFFYNFVSFSVILASGNSFLLLRWISERKYFTSPGVQTLTRVLATSAFGIYLIHVLVLEAMNGWIPAIPINLLNGNASWNIPFVSIVVFCLSFWIVRLLQKIPVLKHIVQ